MFIALVCVLVAVTALFPVTVFLLMRQMRQARAETAYARAETDYAKSAAREFCRLTGDSARMLQRVVTIYACDPELLEQALDSLSDAERASIKESKQPARIRDHCEKITTWTAHYSDFLGQTPIPGEVRIAPRE